MWNTLAKLPALETDHCSVGVNFYDTDGAVYQGYCQEDDGLFYWYSYEHRCYIENVIGWMSLPVAPANIQQTLQPDNTASQVAG